ncbi:extracellular solute-binding protein [Roseovarius aestuariivivens]|uniref:extracellular solute-binding protein n=1 Tax=Roseovarius aestuariivivens TaxID=1888910 RepID=UPI0010801145|nr:extracellular solute-binding protein [Roseovarius aestuariivivens]
MLTRRYMMLTGLAGLAGGVAAAKDEVAIWAQALGRPLRVLVPEGSQANIAPVKALFEAGRGCPVQIVVTDLDSINATLSIEAVTRSEQIDVALPATFGIPDLAEAGAILPLDTLDAQAGGAEQIDAMLYRKGDWFDGRHWGYQTDGDIYMMFYLRDLLEDPGEAARFADRHGVALKPAQDWAELDRQMAWFHRPEDGLYGGCLFRTEIYAAWEWWARFHAKGAWPFSPDMVPQIDGDAGLAALEDMIRSAAHLTGTGLGLFDNWARYKRGDIFANIGWGGTQKSLVAPGSPVRGRVLPAGLPCGARDGQRVPMSYFNWGWSYVVTRHCPVPDLAHAFARFAVSAEVSATAVAATDGYFDPFRIEHYADARIVDTYGETFLSAHREGMKMAIPDLYLARRNEYFGALSHWLGQALTGRETPARALRNIAESWELTTELVGRAPQMARWRNLRESYPATLRDFLRDRKSG